MREITDAQRIGHEIAVGIAARAIREYIARHEDDILTAYNEGSHVIDELQAIALTLATSPSLR